jgi:hypothetical protein
VAASSRLLGGTELAQAVAMPGAGNGSMISPPPEEGLRAGDLEEG